MAVMWLELAADREQRVGLGFLLPLFSFLAAHGGTLRHFDLPATWIAPVAVLFVVASVVLRDRVGSTAAPESHREERRALVFEVIGLFGLGLIVVACRFYALNRVPRDFIGELVFQVVCTSDWRSLLAVNGGSANQAPWAPLGILHYLLTGAVWRFSGSTVLTLCFASAVASVLLVHALYWFVRLLGGPLAAFVGAALYAASPVETVWGRNAMQPFNYPSIVVLLTAAATYLAITRHRLSDWLATVFLMALCRQSFGSAYAAFLIPIGAVAWLLLFDGERLRPSGRKPLLLLVGTALWLAGPALAFSVGAGEWHWVNPLDPRLAGRAFHGAGWTGSSEALIENVRKVVGPIYVGKRGDTIQTPTLFFDRERLTFVSPLAVVLFSAGLPWMLARRRDPTVAVLFSTLAAAVLPGVISTADPHRQASLYPTLCAMAGLTAVSGLRGLASRSPRFARMVRILLVAVALPMLLARSAALYFSQPAGEPPSVAVARSIRQWAEPGTMLVLHLPFFLHVDVAYLLFDDSLVEPFGWMFIDEDKWPSDLRDFQPRFDHLFQRHTRLRFRVPELEGTYWRRLVFVLDDSLSAAPKVDDLRRRYGAVEVEHVRPSTWRGEEGTALTVVTVSQ